MPPVFLTIRKVLRFGSSLALTMPVEFAKFNEIAKGDDMCVCYGLRGVLVASKTNNAGEILDALKEIVSKLLKEAEIEAKPSALFTWEV